MRGARGRWGRVGCGFSLGGTSLGISLNRMEIVWIWGLSPAQPGSSLHLLGVVLFMVIGEKFASQILPRTPKWKRAEGQCEWRMFFYNTFL